MKIDPIGLTGPVTCTLTVVVAADFYFGVSADKPDIGHRVRFSDGRDSRTFVLMEFFRLGAKLWFVV